MTWQVPFKIIALKGEVDYEMHIPNMGNKLYHVKLLKAWSEALVLEPAYNTFLGMEADVHWDEVGTELGNYTSK